MIGKILAPHGELGAALRYVLTKPGAERLPGGTLDGKGFREIHGAAKVLEKAAATDRENIVFHGVLSLHPNEKLDNAKWSEAAQRYMAALGYGQSPWVAVRHNDTEHSHVHIVGLRLDASGKYVDDAFEWKRSRKAVDDIERTFGLTPGAPAPSARKPPTSRELRALEREGRNHDDLPRQRIWRALDAALAEKPATLPELMRELQSHGVRVVPNVSEKADKLSGLRYVHEPSGRSFTASELGPDAKLQAIHARGIAVGELALLRSAQAYDRVLSGRLPPDRAHASEAWEKYLRASTPPSPPAPSGAADLLRARLEEAFAARPHASEPPIASQGVPHAPERDPSALSSRGGAGGPADEVARRVGASGSADREPLDATGGRSHAEREPRAVAALEPAGDPRPHGAAGGTERAPAGADLVDDRADRAADLRARLAEASWRRAAAVEQRGAAGRAADAVAEAGALRGGLEGQPADRSRGGGADAAGSDPRGPAGQVRDLDPSDRRGREAGDEFGPLVADPAALRADTAAQASPDRGGGAVERHERAVERVDVVAADVTPTLRAPRASEAELESYGALLQRLTRVSESESAPSSGGSSGALPPSELVERYAHHRLALEAGAGGRPVADLDFEIARRMRQESLPVEQIAAALESGSPEIAQRTGDARVLALETALRADEAMRTGTKPHPRGPNPEIDR